MKRLSNLILIFIFSLSLAKAQPGSIDWSFQPDFNFQKTDISLTLAIGQDRRVIVGGKFIVPLLNGTNFRDIVFIDSDGSLDTNFKSMYGGLSNFVKSIVVQNDGKIIFGGLFEYFYGKDHPMMIRLNKDGTVDQNFNSKIVFRDDFIRKIELLSDNKILGIVSNKFNLNDKIKRFNKSGAIDTSFKDYNVDYRLFAIALQSDGKILVGGQFTKNAKNGSSILVRLNSNGGIDTTFNFRNEYKDQDYVSSIEIQPDGRILMAGNFQSTLDTNIIDIVRLNKDGSIDKSFDTQIGFESNDETEVICTYLQKDGKIILGGTFGLFNGIKNINIVRLNKNGHLDTEFKTGDGFNDRVTFIESQSEGKIIVGGGFNSFDNYFVDRLIRLNTKNNRFSFSCSPNPSVGIFKVNATQSLKLITITDAIGKEILRTEPMAFNSEIDLSNKAPGLYFVTAFSDGGSKCQKILKQ